MDGGKYYIGAGEVGAFEATSQVLPVAEIASGYQVGVRVLSIEGKESGPTIGITAGVHGDEHTGTEIVRRVITDLDPSKLRGRIEAIPVVNPLAFETVTRNTPMDMLNLNRVFPGSRDGWFTEQLAAVIRYDYLPRIDYLIDLHAGGRRGWVDYVLGLHDRESQLATGSEYIYTGPEAKGTIKDAAKDAGVKENLTLEFGGIDCSSGPMVEKGVRCILNILKHWNALPGSPELPPRQYLIGEKEVLRSAHGGLFYQDPDNAVIGKQVPKDALLARVVNPYTFEVVEEVRAPFDNNIVFHILAHDGMAQPGEYLFQCGNMDKTEVVTNQ